MTRIHWWTLLLISGVCLSAWQGHSVWGQADDKLPGVPTQAANPLPPLPATPLAGQASPLATFPNPVVTPTEGGGEKPARSMTVSTAPPVQPLSEQKPVVAVPNAGTEPGATPAQEARAGKQQPAVHIEWIGPSAARVHQPLPCQIVVRNTASTAVQNVVVRQRLPQGVTCKQCEPEATTEVGEMVWNLGNLAPEQIRRINLVLVSSARGNVSCPATVTFSGAVQHQIDVREPQLVVKMRAPATAIAGESVSLLFAVNNPGDGIAEAVKVKAILPEGLLHARGKEVEVEIGNLGARETRTMKLVCLAHAGGQHKCRVVASAEGDITSTDSAAMEILIPKLDVVLAGPKLRYLDRHAVYVLKIANPGSAPAPNVQVNEVLPAGLKFHQANQGGQYLEAERTVAWTLGDLQPGQSKELAIEVIAVEPGDHRVVAQVKTARGMKTESVALTRVEGLPSLLIELGDSDDPVEVGSDTSYELRVTNAGTKTETNIEVVCTLPEQLEFRSAKCSSTLRYRVEGKELIFEPLPRLAPKADVIYRIQVRGAAAADVRFRTKIRADGLRDPILREESTRIYSDESLGRPAANATPTKTPGTKSTSNAAPAPLDPTAFPLPSLPATNPSVVPAQATTPSVPAPVIPIPVQIPLPPSR